jgi:hypothetical protein
LSRRSAERSPHQRPGIRPAPEHRLHRRAPPPGRFFPMNRLKLPINSTGVFSPFPTPSSSLQQRPIAPPPPPFVPPPPTSTAGRSLPRDHLLKLSSTKVSTGVGSPRPPLPFPSVPGRRRPPRRRQGRPHGPPPTSAQFEGDGDGFLPIPPAPFPFYQNTPPPISLFPSSKLNPKTLKVFTKLTLPFTIKPLDYSN